MFSTLEAVERDLGAGTREAAHALLRLARAQALPGVGPVLHPGQACLRLCEEQHRHHDPR